MAALLGELPSGGQIVLGGDFNTTTIALGTPGGFIAAAARMLLNPRRFRSPARHEPLFARLASAQFQTGGANAEGVPTFTFTRLIPPFLRPKLDWIALRGLAPVDGSARVLPARPSLFAPRVSDHDFVMVDAEPPPRF